MYRESRYGTVMIAVVDEATGKLVLVPNTESQSMHWNLPGGRINETDGTSCDDRAQSYAAAVRIIKEKTGHDARKILLMQKSNRPVGPLYVYAGLVNLADPASTTSVSTRPRTFTEEEARSLSLQATQALALKTFLEWLRT